MSRYSGLKKNLASGWLVLICVCVGLAFMMMSSFLGVQASPFENVQTQMQLNKEACDDYKKADREMNQAYQAILHGYSSDRAFNAAIRKAQLAWIRYRDAHIEALYPGDAGQYGSINPMCRCMQLANITKERTKILNQWVKGVEEGDACGGSVKTK